MSLFSQKILKKRKKDAVYYSFVSNEDTIPGPLGEPLKPLKTFNLAKKPVI